MKEQHLKLCIGNEIVDEPIGFGNSIILENKSKRKSEKHELLRVAKSISLALKKHGISDAILNVLVKDGTDSIPEFRMENGIIYALVNPNVFGMNLIEQRKLFKDAIPDLELKKAVIKNQVNSSGCLSKVLIFRNILNSADKEQCNWFSPGAHYLASSLKKDGIPFVVSNLKMSLDEESFATGLDELEIILKNNPEINIVAITLCEGYFEKARKLARFIRERSKAFIVVGGPMPSLVPEHVLVHMPEADFVVRGDGECILPQIAKILDGTGIDVVLSKDKKESLMGLSGVAFSRGNIFISSKIDKINKNESYDDSLLDFSILEEADVASGLNLFTSRGCHNNCTFCTTVGKGEFYAKSFDDLRRLLEGYKERLVDIFQDREIPAQAFKLSFNDDDFLGDPNRAIKFFKYIIGTPFYVNFIQTGINSFFIREGKYVTEKINMKLLDAMSEDVFIPKKGKRDLDGPYVYLGTENFSDDELKRLGKGYDYRRIEMVIDELSRGRIIQAHHIILSNTETTLDDIFDNLIKQARLRIKYGRYFNILFPTITNLVSFYTSRSYMILLKKERLSSLKKSGELNIKDFQEFDYPLFEKDLPLNDNVAALVDKFQSLKKNKDDYFNLIDNALFLMLFRAENVSLKKDTKSQALAAELYRVIDKYHDYPRIVLEDRKILGTPFENDRKNIQLMTTRNCQLRCKYCPVLKSGEDAEMQTLLRSVDLLMQSKQKSLRIDFTGGEPLLAFDNIVETVNHAKTLALLKGKYVSFYMVTNIMDLSKERVEFIKKEGFQLELSIDGDEQTHNLNKIAADKSQNPYRTFIEKLKLLEDVDKLAVVVVTPQNVRKLYDNFKHVIGLGFRKADINYGLGIYWDSESISELFSQFGRIMEDFSVKFRSGEIVLGNFSKRLEPAILNSEIMVDTDGSIHLMPEWIFDTHHRDRNEFSLGNVMNSPEFSEIFSTRFYSYFILHKLYTNKSNEIKRILINNILLGVKIGRFFKSFRMGVARNHETVV